MNRYIFLFLIAAFSLLLHAKCVAQKNIVYGAGITYTVGVPTFVPPGNSSRVVIDTVTSKWYEYATPGGWRWSGDRVQDISGCAAPAYTPGKAQSRIVLNSCTEAQNGHGPELYKYTGSAWLCLNCGGIYTAGDGIGITGTEITNTGDLSNTNELQTISISGSDITLSNGGGTVSVPGGGVTWPLLAPTADIPVSYSFVDYPNTGIYSADGSLNIVTTNGDAADNTIRIISGPTTTEKAGNVTIRAGDSVDSGGGAFELFSGGSTYSGGGDFSMNSGGGQYGGSFYMNAGSGPDGAGIFQATSGNAINESGGRFQMTAGSSVYETGGTFNIIAGSSEYGSGGVLDVSAGQGINGVGGLAQFRGGSGYTYGGNIELVSGSAVDGTPGDIVFTAGNGLGEYGKIVMSRNKAVSFFPITIAERDSVSGYNAGDNIYCSDCTANDSSTGVLQTYNGSTWKNHW